MRNTTQWLRSMRVVVVAVPLVTVGCTYKTPPPRFATGRVESVPWDSIRAYAQTLRFDTVLYAADVKRVAFDSSPLRTRISETGDSAWIAPEQGAWALDTNALAEGRIIAQITAVHFHQAFGYGPRPTWWWVDKRGGQWRSLYFSDSLKKGIPDAVHLTTHGTYLWRQSLARWGSQWVTCSYNACCVGGPATQ